MDEEGVLQQMRILITQETDWLKRNPAQQHHLAEMLSLRGHEIRVIDYEFLWRIEARKRLYSMRGIFENVSKIHQGANITLIRPGIVKILPWLDYVSLIFSHRREIKRQIKEFSPDVIIGLGILNSYLSAMATKNSNIPFIYYWIDVLHLLIPSKPLRFLGKLVERAVLKRADRVLVINEELKDYVVALGALPERSQVLRAGIDIGRFNPNSDGDAIRKEYGYSEQDVILFFMGWLYSFSGLKEVCSQLAQIENHNLKLFIVGDGDAYNELCAIRDRQGLQDRLILAGKKAYQEIPAFISASDICLLPAYPAEKIMQHIVPIKMYEYMAMRKPVIATKLPGLIKEFGEDNGIVYVDRPEDVVEKAIELIDSASVEVLGTKARSFAEKYDWDRITDQFERILEEATKEKAGTNETIHR